ncbi:MAG: hypothetical protein WAL37_18070 [Xanthobacteraceae bacterium]
MFVRWQSRERRRSVFGYSRDGDMHWNAVLVESVRVNGKATQRHVANLGGITESAIGLDTPAQRMFFWDGVAARLDGLKLEKKQRAAIEQAVAEKVPPVTKRERKRVERDRRALGLIKEAKGLGK